MLQLVGALYQKHKKQNKIKIKTSIIGVFSSDQQHYQLLIVVFLKRMHLVTRTINSFTEVIYDHKYINRFTL